MPFTLSIAILTLSLAASGCRLCADCDLESYPSYGGVWQRTLRDSGRVGSLFDPGGSRAADLDQRADPDSADASLRSTGDDESADPDNEMEDELNFEPGTDDAEANKNGESDSGIDEIPDRLKNLELEDINYETSSGRGALEPRL